MIETAKNVLGKTLFEKIKLKLPQNVLEEAYFWRFYDKKKIHHFKNKYKDERCFIVGNGPSLNDLDLKKLRNEYSFGVNSIFLKSDEFTPTFYVVEDHHVAKDNSKRINELNNSIKFFPRNYKHILKNDRKTYYFNMNTGYYQEYSSNYCIPRFSTDASKRLYCGQSVTIICLQIAFYMGFKEVYLIGMDFNYTIPKDAIIEDGGVILSMSDDPNHFDSTYFGKGKRWHDPHLDRVHRSYQLARICFEAKERKIYNATKGGKLELFERKEFNSLF